MTVTRRSSRATVPGTRTGCATTLRSTVSVRTPVRWTLPGETVTTLPPSSSPA